MSGRTESRQIRVFISSTFTDMKADRDYLVRFIFPQLRKLCESRVVTWGEVDLRWGVTDEQKAEGKVLPIVLAEIENCRPYFIGLLGDRYGQVYRDDIPEELAERLPWLTQHREKSLTELEILHGVLNQENMADRALFYFRDPAYARGKSEAERLNFTSEGSTDREKLAALKERIRQRYRDKRLKYPPRENYASPEALGELVLADLTKIINDLFPEGSQPDPLDREAMDHEAYARSRERVYIGRQEYFDRLNAHAAANDNQALAVLGESGSGKSALLANWVAGYRKAHPDAIILQHYIGATPSSAEWAGMLRRLMGELKRKFEIQQDIPDQPDALRSAFPNWLYMAAARGRIVLVLDALNQLEDRDGAPDLVWLPPVLPENVRLIVSTLPGQPLNEIKKRNWASLTVELLSTGERRELIAEYLGRDAKGLSPSRLERIAGAVQAANPLYLRVLLDELRLVRTHEELEQRIGEYLNAESAYALYGKVIARWQEDYDAGSHLVGDTLSLLWAARRGVKEAELLETLGRDGEPLPGAKWSPLFLAMSDALIDRGGLLTFAHDFLRTAAKDAYIPTEEQQRQAHLQLANYFERQADSSRRIDELPWQLAEAGAWVRLNDLLANPIFFNSAWDRSPPEVKTWWVLIEANSRLRMVETYRRLIESPESEPDKDFLWAVSFLLNDGGHTEQAFDLRSALVERFRESGDLHRLAAALRVKAVNLQSRGEVGAAMALQQEAEGICRQLGDLDGLPRALVNQAILLQDRGNWDRASGLLQEAEGICRRSGNLDALSRTLVNQANISNLRGDLDAAMSSYRKAELICRQLGDLDGVQLTLGNQSDVLRVRGNLSGATALLEEAERICRQLGNLDGLSYTLGNQAAIMKRRGDLDGAAALLEEAERICRQLGNPKTLSNTLGEQAMIMKARGDLSEAMVLFKEQMRVCRQLGDMLGLAASLHGQANILDLRGDSDRSMAMLKEVERICRREGYLQGLSGALGDQALILRARMDLDGAASLLEEAERICRQLGNLDGLATALGNRALILADQGNTEEAIALFKEAERIFRQLGNLDGVQHELSGQAHVLHLRGDLGGAMDLHKKAEAICRQLGQVEGLVRSLANQALVFQQIGKRGEGVLLAKEAHHLAASHGYVALAEQIASFLKGSGYGT